MQTRHPHVCFIGLTEPEVATPERGDAYAGDHAAKYETSIGLALHPGWVRLDRLTAGGDPDQVTLAETPRTDRRPTTPNIRSTRSTAKIPARRPRVHWVTNWWPRSSPASRHK